MTGIKIKVTQGDPGACNYELESSRMTEMVDQGSGILGMHGTEAGRGLASKEQRLVRC
jgi:hypothetical protein